MSAPAAKPDDAFALIDRMGRAAREAARTLALASTETKNRALIAAAAAVERRSEEILAANFRDMAQAEARGLSAALLDRLKLDHVRLQGVAKGLREVAALPDPVGAVIADWTRPNGLRIRRIRTPLGVIGVIYESRPNVTADAGSLCLKAGNAAILRGGSESFHSSRAIHAALVDGLAEAGLPATAIQLVPTTDRAAVGALLAARAWLDVVVPRGGRSLVERVQSEARVPVFAHLEGICHVYIHASADLDKARKIAFNAKMRRTGICGAMETLLVDRAIAARVLPTLIADFQRAQCELRGDAETRAFDPTIRAATEADWSTEYLDAILSIRIVGGLDEAMTHIARYGSAHTESIVTE
ncbi:MAG: glutamate-5-semialdehyde dehydrogenase, partial [Alphaproteobacteria bacterium]|nr:glutamate-5-semialdehyde dehydrogenase [Alphaproteobacteria bacterium]